MDGDGDDDDDQKASEGSKGPSRPTLRSEWDVMMEMDWHGKMARRFG
jgi:hypothetical protein